MCHFWQYNLDIRKADGSRLNWPCCWVAAVYCITIGKVVRIVFGWKTACCVFLYLFFFPSALRFVWLLFRQANATCVHSS